MFLKYLHHGMVLLLGRGMANAAGTSNCNCVKTIIAAKSPWHLTKRLRNRGSWSPCITCHVAHIYSGIWWSHALFPYH